MSRNLGPQGRIDVGDSKAIISASDFLNTTREKSAPGHRTIIAETIL
jgi:hypothetical protein